MKSAMLKLCLLLSTCLAYGDPIIVAIGGANKDWSNESGTGVGDIILEQFVAAYPDEIKPIKEPGSRITSNLKREIYSCALGTDENISYIFTNKRFIGSNPIHTFNWKYVTLKSEPKINSIKQLKGKKLGTAQGIVVNTKTIGVDPKQYNITIVYGPDFNTTVKMLKRGRMDVVTFPAELVKPKMGLHYSDGLTIIKTQQKLVCLENKDESRKAIRLFNQFLDNNPALIEFAYRKLTNIASKVE